MLGEKLPGDDGDDARNRLGPGRVDRLDARVSKRAPEELEVEHPRERDVVEVVSPSADEAGILDALDGVTDSADHLGRH